MKYTLLLCKFVPLLKTIQSKRLIMKTSLYKVILLLVAISFTNTLWAQNKPIKTTKYKYNTVHFPNSEDNSKSYTFKFNIEYFKNPAERSVEAKINHHIQHYFSLPNTENKSIKEVVKGIIDAEVEDYMSYYNESPKDMPDYMLQYTLDMDLTYQGKHNKVYSFLLYFNTFTGGVHPMDNFITLNYDDKTGQALVMDDIFKPDYQYKLSNLILNKLDKEMLFNKYTVDLPTQFTFKEEGIEFIYNRYEIAPYAAGPQYAFLTYKELEKLLKDKYIVK